VSNVARMLPNDQLRRERLRRGWSREYVAGQIGIADAKTIGRWERGVAFPSSYFLQKLCNLFGMMAQDLGLYQGEPEAAPAPRQSPPSQKVTQAPASTFLHDPALPPPLTETGGLVGRDELLALLKQRLCVDKNPMALAFNGLPGVGKTALATELAHDENVRRQYSDGVLWIELGPRPDVPGLLRRLGTLLGCAAEMAHLSSTEAWARAIRSAIGERRMLLVVDDAWKSEEALAFKVGGPNCTYLLTTRIPSVALHFANGGAMRVRELDENNGVRLLAHFVSEFVSEEPGAARALVESVGGLPLGLILMGKYLQSEAYTGQPRRLRAALARLRQAEERLQLTIPQAPLERHTGLPEGAPLSLAALIGMSYWLLDEATRQALARLATFPAKPQSFSEEAALAVSGAPLEVLDNLVDTGLLESAGPGRYTLHRTIADYAGTQRSAEVAEGRLAEALYSTPARELAFR
jgi:transcriptional regulator with XRE-family HTH domain